MKKLIKKIKHKIGFWFIDIQEVADQAKQLLEKDERLKVIYADPEFIGLVLHERDLARLLDSFYVTPDYKHIYGQVLAQLTGEELSRLNACSQIDDLMDDINFDEWN